MSTDELDVVRFEEMAGVFGRDLPTAIRDWHRQARADLADLRAAAAGSDEAGTRSAAHALRAASLTFGAPATTLLAQDIEHRVRSGELPDPGAVAELEVCVDRARDAMERFAAGRWTRDER